MFIKLSSSSLPSMAGALPCINANPVVHTFLRSSPCRRLLSHRPTVVTMSSDYSYWKSLNAEIESHLKEAIPIRHPVSVFEPMNHLTFSAPETTAPALCIAACELVGGQRDQAMAAASALRLIHAAAFTHQQLPLTDRPRPKTRPTVGHAFGPNVELLTGDGLMPFGFELLARLDDPARNNSDRILRVIVEITQAAGSQGMIEGQYNELLYNQSKDEEPVHVDWINDVCKKKEGKLHACGGACGAILGGGREEEIEKLRRFGLYVGMIEGISNWVERKEEKWSMEETKELRRLALKELEGFSQGQVEAIASLLDTKFCNL